MNYTLEENLSNSNKRFQPKPIQYQIDENGCWNCTSHGTNKGYPVVKRGGGNPTAISRYSFELHHKRKIKEGMFICHKCDNKLCINPDHLYEGTRLDNARDAVERGQQPKGERTNHTKLKFYEVMEIKELLEYGKDLNEIAKKFNVDYHTIYDIKRGNTWKHVGKQTL